MNLLISCQQEKLQLSNILIFGGDSDIAHSFKKIHDNVVSTDIYDCDVRIPELVEKEIKTIKPEVVINFAGISRVQLIKNSDIFRWRDEIYTNLLGSYYIAKYGIENNVQKFIFIASVAGMYGKSEHSGYSASKGGIISLVQSMAMEGYNAYSISPGRVNTKMREHDYPGEDIRTRLSTEQVVKIINNCIDGKYQSGSNIIIRKIGYKTYNKIDFGQPWKKYLNVQPYGTPKTI